MQLPTKLWMVCSKEKRRILGEFYDTFARQPWFWRAEYVEAQPKDNIQIYATQPVLELKAVEAFMEKYGLAHEIIGEG